MYILGFCYFGLRRDR